jgi:hypothetical protein
MKTTICILSVIILTFQIHAQSPTIVWQNSFGGSDGDYGISLNNTIDGGLILAGSTNSNDGNVTGNHGGTDCWIIKLDVNYNIEWQKCYGGSEDDHAHCIVQTSDNGYVISASSRSSDGDLTENFGESDIWIVKLNSIGDIDWQKSIGGPNADIGWHVIETTAGDIIVAGQFDNPTSFYDDISIIIKLNSSGVVLWEKYFGGSLYENAKHIIQTEDEGFVFVGEAYSSDGDLTGNYGCSDCWVVKLNSDGIIIWQKNFGGSSYDYADCIIQNTDGSYIMSGYTYSNDFNVVGNHGEIDAWIIKLSSTGNLVWQKCYGGSEYDKARCIVNKSNSGYIFSGSTNSNDGNVSGLHGLTDFWIVEIDNIGEIVWQKCLGGSLEDYSFQIENTSLTESVIIGVSASNDFNVTGNNGDKDFWVVEIDTEVGLNEITISDSTTIYPNPAKENITIQSSEKIYRVEILNSIGQRIYNEIHNKAFVEININRFEQGVYIFRIEYGSTVINKKVIVE